MSRPLFCDRKSNLDYVISVENCPWKEGYAIAKWQDKFYPNIETSRPIKIQYRKDGTGFVSFEGKRYNIGYNKDYNDVENKQMTEKLLSVIFGDEKS